MSYLSIFSEGNIACQPSLGYLFRVLYYDCINIKDGRHSVMRNKIEMTKKIHHWCREQRKRRERPHAWRLLIYCTYLCLFCWRVLERNRSYRQAITKKVQINQTKIKQMHKIILSVKPSSKDYKQLLLLLRSLVFKANS